MIAPVVTYDYDSQQSCANEQRVHTYYTSPRYGFEGGVWKPLEQLRSFVGTIPIACNVQSDGITQAQCLDYNATARELNITLLNSAYAGLIIPVRDLSPQVQNGTVQLVEITRQNITLVMNTSVVAWFSVAYND